MTKAEIRKEIKNRIIENTPKLSMEAQNISSKIITTDAYKNAELIFAYMALSDEVDVNFVIKNALEQQKQVAIPKIHCESMTMDFYLYHNEKSETEAGYCNIQEPDEKAEKITMNHLKEKKILILVPGRAFTKKGHRLGRGKGFYDKYLESLLENVKRENVCLMGVCFECQLVKEIPIDEHDILMDCVL